MTATDRTDLVHDRRGRGRRPDAPTLLERPGAGGPGPLLAALAEVASDPLVVVDPAGRILHASEAFREAFAAGAGPLRGRSLPGLHGEAWGGDRLGELVAGLARGDARLDAEVGLDVPGLGRRAFGVRGRRIGRGRGRPGPVLLAFSDVPPAGGRECRGCPASPSRHEQAVAAAGLILYDWNSATDIATYGGSLSEVLGYEPGELAGSLERWIERIHPDDRASFRAAVERAHELPDPFRLEYRVRHKRGHDLVVRDEGRCVVDSGGSAWVIGLLADVTERARVEEALRASERRFRAVFEQTFQLAGILTPEGTMLEANRTALELCGLSLREVVGRPFWELRCWSAPGAADRIRRAIAEAAAGRAASHEEEITNAAGTTSIVEVAIKPGFDESGAVAFLIPEGRDVTASRTTERQLAEALWDRREVMETIPDILYALDLEGNLRQWNRKLEAMTGLGTGQLEGRPAWDFFPPGDRAKVDAAIRRALDDGYAEVEADLIRPDGTLTPHHYTASPLRDATGAVVGLAGVGRDITERRAIEARLRDQAEALRESRERLRAALAASGTATFRWDLRTGAVEADEEVARLFGLEPPAEGHRVEDYLARVHPDDRATVEAAIAGCTRDGSDLDLEFRVVLPDGRVRWVADKGKAGHDAAGLPLSMTGACLDITRRKLAEEALRESERRFRILVENAADAFFLVDEGLMVLDANRRACDALGYSREELLAMEVSDFEVLLTRPEARDRFANVAPGDAATFEGAHRRRDGTTFPVEVRVTACDLGGRRVFLALARDVTERKRVAAQLEYQATHDALTALPNRANFQARTEAAVAEARARGGRVALLLIDLDGFKEVNDTFGHHYGDAVLREVGPRLRAGLRSSDTVARLGGDEFAILLPGADRAAALAVAERTLRELCLPLEVDGHRLGVGASIGVALCPEHGGDAPGLLRCADAAMYEAKRARAGVALFDARRSHGDPRRLALIADLRRAVEDGQLLLHYQPQVDLESGSTRGCEALARWLHPAEGLIAPGQFIPLAEQAGLIRPLGAWALEATMRQCVAWSEAGFEGSVSVNLAADNLQDPDLPAVVASLLRRTGARPGGLTVEVTEGAMMADPERAKSALVALHDQGLRVAIDDFGTGYSSLAYLKDLPADEVKVDRAFVREILFDERAACITRAVIDLGHSLGLEVVAEGVEDRATEELLSRWGCDTGQGFLYARPLAPGDYRDWCSRREAAQSRAPRPAGQRRR